MSVRNPLFGLQNVQPLSDFGGWSRHCGAKAFTLAFAHVLAHDVLGHMRRQAQSSRRGQPSMQAENGGQQLWVVTLACEICLHSMLACIAGAILWTSG